MEITGNDVQWDIESRLHREGGREGRRRRSRETLVKDPKFPFLRSVKSGYRQLDPAGDS